MQKRRALILGITGRVGTGLTPALRDDGWDVVGAARCSNEASKREIEDLGVAVTRFDILKDDPASLPDVDVVFLEIWDPTSPENFWSINFYGVGRVVERYAGKADFVNGCSSAVYGESVQSNKEDETPPRPSTEYGRSRFAQERLIDYFCQTRGSRGIHLRYMHANSVKKGYVRRMAEVILRESSLGPDPDARVQVIAIEDFVRMTRLAVDHMANPPAVVNCCHPRSWTQRELAEAIHERLARGKVVFDRESGGAENSRFGDTTRMVEWFGEPTVSLEVVLDRVAADLK